MSFLHPSTILVAGPTQCGKTQFIRRVLKEKLITPFPDRLMWAYGEWQPAYDHIRLENPKIEFVKGLDESLYKSITPDKNNLLVLDDLMSEAGESKLLSTMFTKGSHHKNLSLVYIVQNIFDRGKSHRSCSLNSHYIVLFKNPRDIRQIDTIGRQMISTNKVKLSQALEHATRRPHGYLLVDLRNDTPPEYKFRTDIFPSESSHQLVYKAPADISFQE